MCWHCGLCRAYTTTTTTTTSSGSSSSKQSDASQPELALMDCTRHPPPTIGCISKLIEEPIVFLSLLSGLGSLYIYFPHLSFVVYTLYLKSAAAAAAASFFLFLSNRLHVCACALVPCCCRWPGHYSRLCRRIFFFFFCLLLYFYFF